MSNNPSPSKTDFCSNELHDESEDSFEMHLDDLTSNIARNSYEPSIDMEFEHEEEAYQFYNSYALKIGFSVRKNNRYVSKRKGKCTTYRFVCSKEGKPPTNKTTPQRETSSQKTGCKASLSIKLHEDEKWRISTFKKDHNHELILSPSKKRNLKSHKIITEEQREDIKLLSEQGIKPSQIWEILAEKSGSRRKLCFSTQDVNNIIGGEYRRFLGVDVKTTISCFNKMKERDADFFFAIETDVENSLRNIFWIDGRSRRSYQEFNDVIIFDTTYSTNKYSMPCAPFIGIHHHLQSVPFGCALIRDERKTTFEWVYNTWLQAMHHKYPKAIITDQDPAMKSAIATIFPGTVHRCCQWHVMRKATEHLAKAFNKNNGLKEDLLNCINKSLTVGEFEENWQNMIQIYNLQSHEHLKTMFDKRIQWAPAYFRDTFFADMSTSQRSESMNAKLKMYVGSNTPIYRFVIQFEKMRAGIHERESDLDIKTKDKIPKLWSKDKIEEDARRVYTKKVFKRFQENLNDGTGYSVNVVESDSLYELKSMKFSTSYQIRIDKPNSKVSCDCKGFECEGLLCPHSLQVMRSIGMHSLPDHYVLKRWTKDVNESAKRIICFDDMEFDEFLPRNSGALTEKIRRVSSEAQKSNESYLIACQRLDDVIGELTAINGKDKNLEAETNNTPSGSVEPDIPEMSFGDPPQSQCKGKRKPHRFKPPVETNPKKMRTCSFCGKKAGHNNRTCGKKKSAEEEMVNGDHE